MLPREGSPTLPVEPVTELTVEVTEVGVTDNSPVLSEISHKGTAKVYLI